MRLMLNITLVGLLAGCEETLVDDGDNSPKADIIGSIEQVDSQDPNAPWLGTEFLRVVDTRGEVVCESDWDLDAIDAGASTCEGCDVTLDVIRSAVDALAEDCEVVMDTSSVVTASRFLAFSNTARDVDANHGRILVADSADGPWQDYAGGANYDGRIVYHRTVRLDDGEVDPSLADPRLRPLNVEPIRFE